MGNQAIANPEEIERFAKELRQFTQQLKESVGRINGGFSRLGETWHDQEHEKFATEFEKTVREVTRFLDNAERHIPFLERKARALRDYLNQR